MKTLFQLIAEQKNHDNGTCGDALSDVECVIVSIAPAWEKNAGLEGHTYQTNRKKIKLNTFSLVYGWDVLYACTNYVTTFLLTFTKNIFTVLAVFKIKVLKRKLVLLNLLFVAKF